MMKPAFFLSIILIFTFSSCRKKDKEPQMTTVTGKVVTKGTEEPIKHPPVKVQIVERVPVSTWGSGPNYEVRTETMSGEDHSFSLSHELDPEKDYYLAVDESTVKRSRHYIAPSYGSTDHESRKINSVGGTINLNYNLSAYGWVEFHFANNDPDQITRFAYNFGAGAYEEFFGSFNLYRTWDFAGHSTHNLYFGITTVNGKDSLWQDELIVPAFDTIPYQVKF